MTPLPVMVHIGAEPPSIDEVLDLLRPGDIVTHCMTSQSMSLLAHRGGIRRSTHKGRCFPRTSRRYAGLGRACPPLTTFARSKYIEYLFHIEVGAVLATRENVAGSLP